MCQEFGINRIYLIRYVIFVDLLMSYIDLELLKLLQLFLALNKTETKLPRSDKNKTAPISCKNNSMFSKSLLNISCRSKHSLCED